MIDQPPAEYRNYSGPLILQELPYQRMKTACFALGARWEGTLYGCSIPSMGNCLVIIPAIGPMIDAKMHRQILTHELGHCQGWRHE